MTPNQIDFIKDETVDLSINTASFAEMTKKDIEIYFELIQRVSNNGGYFLNHNRVHKNPEGKDEEINKNLEPNFSEYPYKNNEVIIYDICRLVQLLEKDPFMLRLEKSLSNMIKYCKSCLLPNTKPYIRFNSSNVCSACILHFSKNLIKE